MQCPGAWVGYLSQIPGDIFYATRHGLAVLLKPRRIFLRLKTWVGGLAQTPGDIFYTLGLWFAVLLNHRGIFSTPRGFGSQSCSNPGGYFLHLGALVRSLAQTPGDIFYTSGSGFRSFLMPRPARARDAAVGQSSDTYFKS